MAQLDARPTGDKEIAGSTPPGRQHSFVEIDHVIFSTIIQCTNTEKLQQKVPCNSQ